jgi:hypothetical protein
LAKKEVPEMAFEPRNLNDGKCRGDGGKLRELTAADCGSALEFGGTMDCEMK